MYSVTPLLTRMGFADSPTTAMVFDDLRISAMFDMFDIEFQHLAEPLDLLRGQRTMLARRHIQLQESDLHAAQLLDQSAEMLEHHADLILPSFSELHLIPGIRALLN